MKIALLNTMTPYIRGGAEILVDNLYKQLQVYGHTPEIYRLPFPTSFEGPLIRTIAAARMLRFDDYDRVIAFKFPAYCVRHQSKVMWMFHQFRQVYDLWGTNYGLQSDAKMESLRHIIKEADEKDISLSRHIYTIAGEVTKRLKQYNHINSQVIYPPLDNIEKYNNNSTGDYFFYPSRINALKRQQLAVEAMRYVNSGVKLIIAGKEDEQGYIEAIYKTVRMYNLEERVTIINEWISEEYKRELIANSLGVMFIPYKEDYGFVTLEAFYSSKPVITCEDAGGPSEFVDDGLFGYTTGPSPVAIAKAMDMLYDDKNLAERMGIAAHEGILEKNITWTETIRRLLL